MNCICICISTYVRCRLRPRWRSPRRLWPRSGAPSSGASWTTPTRPGRTDSPAGATRYTRACSLLLLARVHSCPPSSNSAFLHTIPFPSVPFSFQHIHSPLLPSSFNTYSRLSYPPTATYAAGSFMSLSSSLQDFADWGGGIF